MNPTATRLIIFALLLMACSTSVYLVKQREAARLAAVRKELASLQSTIESIKQQQLETLRARDRQIEQLRKEAADVHRLRAEVDRLTREVAEQARRASTVAPGTRSTPSTAATAPATEATSEADEDWKQSVARIRAKMFGIGGPATPEEIAWLRAAQPKLEQLERDPTQFAGFQSEMIKTTVPTLDATRQRQISDIIRQTYEAAVAQGLDLPSKPADSNADWVARRHALDRLATEAVQELLTGSERQQFDRRFLGVMGVDLGVGVDQSNYPPGFLGAPAPGGQ